jgi:hypothetical protein
MRKLILVAALALVAVVVAPITSASADWFKGTCTVQGKAEFGEGLEFNTLKTTWFKFKKGPVGAANFTAEADCKGNAKKGAGAERAGPFTVLKAEVKGELVEGKEVLPKGDLECGTKSKDKELATTEALIELQGNGEIFKAESRFRFKSTGVPGEIEVKLTPKGEVGEGATGFANFTGPSTPGPTTTLLQCVRGEATNLSFETASEGPAPTVGITGKIGE